MDGRAWSGSDLIFDLLNRLWVVEVHLFRDPDDVDVLIFLCRGPKVGVWVGANFYEGAESW